MARACLLELPTPIWVNGVLIKKIKIGDHYKDKHEDSINDELIISLVRYLSGHSFVADSSSKGIEYFVTDIEVSNILRGKKVYRLVWFIEGDSLDVIGVVNAFRVNRKRK